jgi:hypothetical protein
VRKGPYVDIAGLNAYVRVVCLKQATSRDTRAGAPALQEQREYWAASEVP